MRKNRERRMGGNRPGRNSSPAGIPEGQGRNSSRESPGTGTGTGGIQRDREGIPAGNHPGQGQGQGQGGSRGTGKEFQPGSSRDSAPRRGRGAALECGKLEDLLERLENDLEKRQNEKKSGNSRPDTAGEEREEKFQPEKDVKSSSRSCGEAGAAPALQDRISLSWRSRALKETLRKLQVSVTLDPDTAHPDLVLSRDFRSVRRVAGAPRALPDSPERFDHWPFVLGHQRFGSGRHCWTLDVGDGGDWAVGVARESVPRKGRLRLGPPGGIWGLEKWGGQVRAMTGHKVTLVALRALPRRVSVHLDCGGGTVAFLDAEGGGLLFAFSRVAFGGERVRPWLWVVGARSRLRLCP